MYFDYLIIALTLLGLACILLAGIAGYMLGLDAMRSRANAKPFLPMRGHD